jgi:hypothetical protein
MDELLLMDPVTHFWILLSSKAAATRRKLPSMRLREGWQTKFGMEISTLMSDFAQMGKDTRARKKKGTEGEVRDNEGTCVTIWGLN